MNDALVQVSLQAMEETVVSNKIEINWWFWISIFEFGVIGVLILTRKLNVESSKRKRFRKESIEQDVDFNNIINSSFNSIKLYNELKVKCHPDRFPTNKEENLIAEHLFQEITKSKNNSKRLLELKEEAKQKLNITF